MSKPQSISKSQYIQGLQCQKRLWLYLNRKDLLEGVETDAATQSRFDVGHEIGALAQQYFEGGVEVKVDYWDLALALEQTAKLIKEETIIFEACSASKDGLYSKIDILKRVKGGKNFTDEWDLIEVKSSTGIKDYHVDDMASQRYAFEKGGFNIRKSILMHINNQYERVGKLDIKKLFTLEDCTDLVLERMKTVAKNLKTMQKTLSQKKEPKIACGDHCQKPFDCPYMQYCGFSANHAVATGDVIVDKRELRKFVDTLEYPLYFFDYETVNPAIPYFDHTLPYIHYPFQYSLHIQKTKGGPLEHFEFLHTDTTDPREALVKQLIKDCGKEGSVIAYNMSFERGINQKLTDLFPKYRDQILAINTRMVDLITPFRKKYLQHPKQMGSNSIKAVLPAFCPELSYEKLGIGDGLEASARFLGILTGKVDGAEKEKILINLKEYCGLDTLAMVKLLEVIYSYTKN